MAVEWFVIGLLVIIILLVIFKSQDVIFISALVKKYFFFFVVAAIVLFLAFSLYGIHTTFDADFTSLNGILGVGKVYLLWMKSVLANFGEVTSYAIKQEWLVNASNSTG